MNQMKEYVEVDTKYALQKKQIRKAQREISEGGRYAHYIHLFCWHIHSECCLTLVRNTEKKLDHRSALETRAGFRTLCQHLCLQVRWIRTLRTTVKAVSI